MSVIKSKRGASSMQFLETAYNLQNLISQLDIAHGLFEVESKQIIKAMELVAEELKLLKALKKSLVIE